jgi:hypothetical protein
MHDVAIVGGGPVGMWLAAELRRGGVSPVVLERRAQPTPHSKAMTILPRTVELLAMRGIHDRWLAEGTAVPSSHFALLTNRLDFSFLASTTAFPFALFLPQRPGRFVLLGSGPCAGYDDRLTVISASAGGDWSDTASVLIRPDGYVAWSRLRSDPPSPPPLEHWLGSPIT